MDAVSLLQQTAKSTHEWLDMTVGDVTSEQAQWAPPNGANIGAHYAHIATSEDAMINAIVRGESLMAATSWAGKTGLSEPMPQGAFDEWSRNVRIDMPALRSYSQAVFANTEAYIASLTPEDLDRPIDLTSWGVGIVPLGIFISSFAIANTNCHCGEISFIKGLQGLKGYPL